MPSVSVKELIESGVHFGHKASRWNPKMKPYIHSKRNLIHIIDLKETVRGLVRARHFLRNVAAQGGLVLFVATKRQARDVIKEAAASCGMPAVTERWLGGMLTNYNTVRSRLKKLEDLERSVETGEVQQYSKKVIATIHRNIRKLRRNLDGVRIMDRLPDAVVIVDPRRETIALKEAHKLHVPTVCILDTDCDPQLVDICIPANDDAMRSVKILATHLAESINVGKKEYEQRVAVERKKAEERAVAESEKQRIRKENGAKKKADAKAVQTAMEARWDTKPDGDGEAAATTEAPSEAGAAGSDPSAAKATAKPRAKARPKSVAQTEDGAPDVRHVSDEAVSAEKAVTDDPSATEVQEAKKA